MARRSSKRARRAAIAKHKVETIRREAGLPVAPKPVRRPRAVPGPSLPSRDFDLIEPYHPPKRVPRPVTLQKTRLPGPSVDRLAVASTQRAVTPPKGRPKLPPKHISGGVGGRGGIGGLAPLSPRLRALSSATLSNLQRSLASSPLAQTLSTITKGCKERPDPSLSRKKGSGPSRSFIPWCDR